MVRPEPARPSLAPHPRPVRDPGLGGHAAADPGGAGRPRYVAWLDRWPTVAGLAAATPAEAITAWSGLGYNRRAVTAAPLRRGGRRAGRLPARPARAGAAARRSARTPPRRSPALRSAPRSRRRTRTPGACSGGPSATRPRAAAGPGLRVEPGPLRPRPRGLHRPPAALRLCPLAPGCPSRGRTYAPLRRQSRFEGSFRQRRARLLRAIAAAGLAARRRGRRRGARLARARRPGRGLGRPRPAACPDNGAWHRYTQDRAGASPASARPVSDGSSASGA